MRLASSKNKEVDAKHFIEHRKGKRVRPPLVKPPQINSYHNKFRETKYMSFSMKNKNFLEKYDKAV